MYLRDTGHSHNYNWHGHSVCYFNLCALVFSDGVHAIYHPSKPKRLALLILSNGFVSSNLNGKLTCHTFFRLPFVPTQAFFPPLLKWGEEKTTKLIVIYIWWLFYAFIYWWKRFFSSLHSIVWCNNSLFSTLPFSHIRRYVAAVFIFRMNQKKYGEAKEPL